jgi:membrane-bound ClpP family serine protease
MAVAGIIALVIAAILELVKVHQNLVIWLVILGAVLIGIEVAWGRYGTRFRRRPVA